MFYFIMELKRGPPKPKHHYPVSCSQQLSLPEAVFLVMCDPSMNEL